MTERCDQCANWKIDDDHEWEARSVGFRKCAAVRPRWVIQDEASDKVAYGPGREDAYIKSRRDALLAARAYVQDGSEYRAELMTGPDFSCPLFRQR